MAGADERAQLHETLCAAIASEHRLYETAAAEEQAARRWEARAALARRKEAPELIAAAQERAAAHAQRARACQAESQGTRALIAQLKAALRRPAAAPVRLPPIGVAGDAVGGRLTALERETHLERDLAELKRQLGR
jgi:hypothetical protein